MPAAVVATPSINVEAASSARGAVLSRNTVAVTSGTPSVGVIVSTVDLALATATNTQPTGA